MPPQKSKVRSSTCGFSSQPGQPLPTPQHLPAGQADLSWDGGALKAEAVVFILPPQLSSWCLAQSRQAGSVRKKDRLHRDTSYTTSMPRGSHRDASCWDTAAAPWEQLKPGAVMLPAELY